MLKKTDLSLKITKKEYKAEIKILSTRFAELQRQIIDLKIPVIIAFEGWSAAGKGTCISKILYPLDPRYFNVHTMDKISEDAAMRPFLWDYWRKTPSKGRIAIFDKSWYRTLFPDRRYKRLLSPAETDEFYYDADAFERKLSDDGTLIVKFFLHISKLEQKKRFDKLLSDDDTKWRVDKRDISQNKNYEAYLEYFENMIRQGNCALSQSNQLNQLNQWNIIEAEDTNYATVKIYKLLINKIEKEIEKRQSTENKAAKTEEKFPQLSILSSVSPDKNMPKNEYKEKLDFYQKKLSYLGYKLYSKRKPVVIVYEGWDAAGKGGNIRRLTQELDPRGYEVIPAAAPSHEELAHHYLWRFWKSMPKDGHIAIFDRSWYGRILVERVEGFCTEHEWHRAYREINDMEKHLHNHGTAIFKFWLHIDKNEQLNRFNERESDTLKQHKITEEDWRNRDKWEDYEKAVDEMFLRTSTSYAPWVVVESNNKKYARIKTLKIITDTLEEILK